jgi:hypothetical protein
MRRQHALGPTVRERVPQRREREAQDRDEGELERGRQPRATVPTSSMLHGQAVDLGDRGVGRRLRRRWSVRARRRDGSGGSRVGLNGLDLFLSSGAHLPHLDILDFFLLFFFFFFFSSRLPDIGNCNETKERKGKDVKGRKCRMLCGWVVYKAAIDDVDVM